jgi:hypothetical protein
MRHPRKTQNDEKTAEQLAKKPWWPARRNHPLLSQQVRKPNDCRLVGDRGMGLLHGQSAALLL